MAKFVTEITWKVSEAKVLLSAALKIIRAGNGNSLSERHNAETACSLTANEKRAFVRQFSIA